MYISSIWVPVGVQSNELPCENKHSSWRGEISGLRCDGSIFMVLNIAMIYYLVELFELDQKGDHLTGSSCLDFYSYTHIKEKERSTKKRALIDIMCLKTKH